MIKKKFCTYDDVWKWLERPYPSSFASDMNCIDATLQLHSEPKCSCHIYRGGALSLKFPGTRVFETVKVTKEFALSRPIKIPGGPFLESPEGFSGPKSHSQTPTRLFCEADLFICCKGNKNLNNCKVSCLETPLF